MKAEIALLKEALKDPANTKFVFLSESTIPIMPFDGVYKHLLSHPSSEFPYYKNMDTTRSFGKIKHIYKNPQWIVLNRKHAQLMVEDNDLINYLAQIPYDNEHYPATFLAQKMCFMKWSIDLLLMLHGAKEGFTRIYLMILRMTRLPIIFSIRSRRSSSLHESFPLPVTSHAYISIFRSCTKGIVRPLVCPVESKNFWLFSMLGGLPY